MSMEYSLVTSAGSGTSSDGSHMPLASAAPAVVEGGGDSVHTPTSIHSLPHEVLGMVFEQVGTKTLLCVVVAVCRTWNAAVANM
jgi:hypothetical protein